MTNDESRADLLREVHHRAFNNLQIVTSLLMLHEQATNCKCCNTILRRTRLRVDTMARIQRGLGSINTAVHVPVEQLFDAVLSASSKGRNLSANNVKWLVEPPEVAIPVDNCVALAMLTMELVDLFEQRLPPGALSEELCLEVRYASKPGTPRTLSVRIMCSKPLQAALSADSFPDMLIPALCEQLQAALTWSSDGRSAYVELEEAEKQASDPRV